MSTVKNLSDNDNVLGFNDMSTLEDHFVSSPEAKVTDDPLHSIISGNASSKKNFHSMWPTCCGCH